jgi:hypothetical protein
MNRYVEIAATLLLGATATEIIGALFSFPPPAIIQGQWSVHWPPETVLLGVVCTFCAWVFIRDAIPVIRKRLKA